MRMSRLLVPGTILILLLSSAAPADAQTATRKFLRGLAGMRSSESARVSPRNFLREPTCIGGLQSRRGAACAGTTQWHASCWDGACFQQSSSVRSRWKPPHVRS